MSEIINETINELNKPTPNNIFSIEDDPVTILEKMNQVERYLEQIDTHVDTSINTANEALEKANNAFEANGTLVKINGENQLTWSADFAETERQKSKNLFNAPSITLPTGVTYNSSTNTFTYTNGEVAEGGTKFVILNKVVMPAGNYVYSFDSTSTITGDTTYIVAKLTSTGGFESQIASKVSPAGKVSFPFTLTEDTYIGLCWYYKTGWAAGSAPAGSKTISNVQLEQGSTATDYQPYYGAIVHQGDVAPVVIYDKNSANPSINKGYTSGIMSDGVGNVRVSIDFSPYKKVKIYANLDRMNAVSEYDFTSGTDQFSVLCGDIASARAKVNYMSGYISKTEFRPVFAGLAETAKDNNANYYVYRIEGIK